MKFLVIDQLGGLLRGKHIIEADLFDIAENGTLAFYEATEDGEIISVLACFALGCWHSVFKMNDDGSIAMVPEEDQWTLSDSTAVS